MAMVLTGVTQMPYMDNWKAPIHSSRELSLSSDPAGLGCCLCAPQVLEAPLHHMSMSVARDRL